MAYTKKTWTDRTVERPLTYILQDNGDGTHTLIPSEGSILTSGTPITAANMNNIEDGIANAHTDIATANGRIDTANANISSNSGLITGLRTDVDTINTYPKIVLPSGSVPRYEGIDMNNLNQTGWYLVNNAINRPPVKGYYNPENWYYVQVIAHDDLNYIAQICYDYHDGIYQRRRHWLDTKFVWTEWKTPSTEGKQIFFGERNGAIGLAANTWYRMKFTSLHFDEGKMYVPNVDTLNIKITGWYRVFFRTNFVQSYGTNFWVEFWETSGTGKKTNLIYTAAPSNGWNYYFSDQTMFLNRNETWEFVVKHGDTNYTRNIDGYKCFLERV